MRPLHATVAPVAAVRAHVAHLVLRSPNETDVQLGSVTLQRHQIAAVARLREKLAQHRGALLADEVGLGKTYTALGVARLFKRVEIVAPAALRAMWHEACARCDIVADFVSSESLSRTTPAEGAPELVIVDEAHWFRNRATQRYQRLARRCRNAIVLLLSATPVHNRPADVDALFALFLGVRALRLAPHEMVRLTVRRDRRAVAAELGQAPPEVRPTHWWRVQSDADVVAAIDAIQAPVPPRDGGLALALLRLTLLRRLSSSHAALRATLRRMLARALALLDAAHAGNYPNARELCAWLVGEEAIQLALPGLVAVVHNERLSLDAIERHVASVRAALGVLSATRNADRSRAARLRMLLRRFPNARIVAFSQYDATVRALARELRHLPGIAMLSGTGAGIASGRISRTVVLRQFDAVAAPNTVHASMHIRLLLTTDLLSEGVNLHNARVVVHLDVPWTPARLEQRVGRLSRIGSPHREVHAFGFAPPTPLEKAQRLVSRLRAKWSASRRRFGSSALLSHDALVARRGHANWASSYAADEEMLLQLLATWLGNVDAAPGSSLIVGCATTASPGALALLQVPDGQRLAVFERTGAVTTQPGIVLGVARRLTAAHDIISPDSRLIAHTLRRFARYLATLRGHDAATTAFAGSESALLSRISQVTTQVTRSGRPRALQMATAIRAALQHVRSAGDLAVLRERATILLNGPLDAGLPWLERAYAELVDCFPSPHAAHAHDYRIVAILIGT